MMEELKNNKPTAAWQQRMEDDEIFTVESGNIQMLTYKRMKYGF